MKDLIDQMAIAQRSKTANVIWTEVRNTIRSKYTGVPVHMMTKNEVISRVSNQRHGGQRADRLSDIENPNLALSLNGINPFLCFSTPLYDPSSRTTAHRIVGWYVSLVFILPSSLSVRNATGHISDYVKFFDMMDCGADPPDRDTSLQYFTALQIETVMNSDLFPGRIPAPSSSVRTASVRTSGIRPHY